MNKVKVESLDEFKNDIIRFKGGFFGYSSKFPILKSLDFTIHSGESVAILGPSGQGKTTLLKLMGNLYQLNKGDFFLFEKKMNELSKNEEMKVINKIGFLFQKNALFDSLNVFDNVSFPLFEQKNTIRFCSLTLIEKVKELLEEVGLSHAYTLFPSEMSGGMQKRLGIARALALDPTLILFDNPTAGLDPITSEKIINLIQKRKTPQRTLVTVVNDFREARLLADRIFFVFSGEVLDGGSPENCLCHSDLRVQQFIHGLTDGPLTEKFV